MSNQTPDGTLLLGLFLRGYMAHSPSNSELHMHVEMLQLYIGPFCNMQAYGEIRSLYTACKPRGFVVLSFYDLRASCLALHALQGAAVGCAALHISFSTPKDMGDKDAQQGQFPCWNKHTPPPPPSQAPGLGPSCCTLVCIQVSVCSGFASRLAAGLLH